MYRNQNYFKPNAKVNTNQNQKLKLNQESKKISDNFSLYP